MSFGENKTLLSGGVFNVKDRRFAGGAKGDGVTDDTAAINAASAAASAAGGGVVYFPSTPDSWSFTFTLPDVGVHWKLEGAGDLIDRTKLGGTSGVKAVKADLFHLAGDHNTGSPYRQVANFTRVVAEGSGGNT